MKIGVIGNGFVGNAVFQNVKEKYEAFVYDEMPERRKNTLEETINSDLIFVCLPTPMISAEGGDCNLSILRNFFKGLPHNLKGIFIIKSTVPIGTTKSIQQLRPDLNIVHNPEFLTAANAVQDFKNSERNVVGGEYTNAKIVADFLQELLPNAKSIIVSSDESESIKYFANTFLATKVAFFNYIYDISLKLGMNYDSIISGVCTDSRIGYSHTKIPGPDGDRGFGGTCFPKDINALINTFEKLGLENEILKEVWEYNKKIRKDWDWANSKSAVLKDE